MQPHKTVVPASASPTSSRSRIPPESHFTLRDDLWTKRAFTLPQSSKSRHTRATPGSAGLWSPGRSSSIRECPTSTHITLKTQSAAFH
eukprot:3326134-Pleurochrysis_carterae.AAC.2